MEDRPIGRWCCSDVPYYIKNEVFVYIEEFREFGIPVCDGGSSFIVVKYCPWCGAKFPKPLRDLWYARLDEMGIDPDEENRVPEEMKSDLWWRKGGL